MNWGYKILLVYSLFVTGIISMAVMSSRQTLDMENENYYEAEKDQDNRMQQRTMGRAFKPLIQITQTGEKISFLLPDDITKKQDLKGILKFTRPSDATLDKSILFTEIHDNELSVAKNDLKYGFWKYSLEWSTAYGHYLIEDTLTIQ